jgi:deoxyribodipyrimidine photo-lyase
MELSQLVRDPRVTVRNHASVRADGRCVVYWMQRAQRASDNPALDLAISSANLLGKPVVTLFVLVPFRRANHRHYQFLAEGLPEIAEDLERRGVGFALRRDRVDAFAAEIDACLVVGDENPLREPEAWRRRVGRELRVPLYTVDADVVVPTQLIGREHWAAYTIRPRIHEHLAAFLVKPRDVRPHVRWTPPRIIASIDPAGDVLAELSIDRAVSPVSSMRGGPRAARARMRAFVRDKLDGYAARRNMPELDGTSGLSPYLHFGHLGPRALAVAVDEADVPAADRAAFLEELIVRRELAINFVRYNDAYDRLDGCPDWARTTLRRHARDTRLVIPADRLRAGESPDPLWNAAQRQMTERGWMHGYLRMYWAKRLLEWTRSPDDAFALAIELNDAYELDGRDPNGYAGIAWAIGGKHDRAFRERPVFGKVRFMSFASVSKKFDSKTYLHRYGKHP